MLPLKKWNVHRAPDLNSQLPNTVRKYVDRIEEKAVAGECLDAHYSTLIDKHFAKDGLLFDLGVFHLHPGHGDKKAKDGFVNRASELLFVYPNNDELHFICLGDHDSFTCKSILESLCTAWPHVLDEHKIQMKMSYALESDEEILNARRSGMNYAIEINGNCYMAPGGGVTVSGDSSEATDWLVYIKSELTQIEDRIKRRYEELIKGRKDSANNNYEIKLIEETPEQFMAKEFSTDVLIMYDRHTGAITINAHH